ncbi:hypothetical protein D9756_007762 [Leucocoprinus leucothites]|uniref:Uncharacterized protein n=1 Tax=Leucocoprinus leucothites TaxID=201217 RepID=A0A8H5FWE6_9AGAR|nr:hypothetical protein D9756_007762 [Leucoagaricus leucothites]
MASPVQFSVDDSSPAIAYSPFGDTLTFPNLSAGWNPYLVNSGFVSSLGQIAVGQSQHITSLNGASVTLEWNGTSIQLFGNTTASASFNLTLDGAAIQPNQTNATSNLLTSFEGLSNARHSISLTANIPDAQDSLLVFDKAVITSPPPDNFSEIIFTEHTVGDDNINFFGQWSFLSTSQPPIHQSQIQSDTARVTFSGISVRIFGTASPDSGNYSVLLDDRQSPIFSARSSFTNTNTLLFFASGLAANTTHQITIRNEGGLLQLKSGGFITFSSGDPTALPPPGNNGPSSNTTFPPPPAPPPALSNRFTRGTIAALVLAGFLTFVILTALLFYFCIWRPRRRQRRRRHYQNQRDLDFAYVSPASRFHHPRKPIFRTHRDSTYPQEKDQEPAVAVIEEIPATGPGAVLDIGHPQREASGGGHPDDVIPDAENAIGRGSSSPRSGGGVIGGGDGGRHGHRDSGKSGFSGFTRWKRDINTLSGLTALGLNFRHSDEKSPASEYGVRSDLHDSENGTRGFIYGTYDPGTDGGAGNGVRAGRMKSVSTQSSSRSFGRFGKRRSGTHQSGSGNGHGNGKGKGRFSSRIGSIAFPFRLSSSSRRGESSGHGNHHHAPRDDESLSGFTSLSYASNPNMTGYLDIQPPSYAASVSASGSNASSPPSVPRSVTRSPQSQSRELGVPGDFHGPSSLSEEIPAVPFLAQQQPTQSAQDQPTGMHILGVGGGSSSVGSPISVRAALRGLSPRISTSRSTERRRSKAKGKEREREQKEGEVKTERRQRQLPSPPREEIPSDRSRSDIANTGHEPKASDNTSRDTAASVAAPPVAIPSNSASTSGTRPGSPIRALPPIPIPSTSSSSTSPQSRPPPQSHPRGPDIRPSELRARERLHPQAVTSPPSSYLSVPESSPFKLSFDQSHAPTPPGTNSPAPPSSSSSSSNNERRFKARSSSGDAAGLGSPGAVQSFAEAAALAGAPSSSGILVEGGSIGSGDGGDGGDPSDGTVRRLSTASRVRFENVPPSSSTTPTSLNEDKGQGRKTGEDEKQIKSRFRLTPISGQSPPSGVIPLTETSDTSPVTADSNLTSAEAGQGATQPPEFAGTSSFIDFSSQPSSLHSRRTSEATGVERNTSIGTTDSTRHWSMQLPGRNIIPTPSGGLKSKWSNTTSHTARTRSESSSSSGYGSPAAQSGQVASELILNRNIFPFPLAIPPSPNMPEGFAGVEPSPSLMSPTASIPVFSPAPRRNEFGQRLHVPSTSGTTRGGARASRQHMRDPSDDNDIDDHHETSHSGYNNETAADSPTDSFPYSISEVHFRTSVGTESDLDLETGRIQYARQHSIAHPPLPSTPLTPQRFNPQQEQPQPQQGSGSIVQRVFGGSATGGSGSGSATPRTPLSGFLKPSNL